MLTVSMPPLACAAARAPPRGDRPLEPGLVFSGAIVSMGSCRASGGDGRKAGPQASQRPMCSADRGAKPVSTSCRRLAVFAGLWFCMNAADDFLVLGPAAA